MKHSRSRSLPELAINTISYFNFFGFPPSFEEIYAYFPVKTTRAALARILNRLRSGKKLKKAEIALQPGLFYSDILSETGSLHILELQNKLKGKGDMRARETENSALYTLPQYSIFFRNRLSRQSISRRKLKRALPFLKILALPPFIRMIGISGSLSMLNCRKTDDVDIFVVTSKNLLFTARFWTILLAVLMRKRQGPDSVCLNLFMTETDMAAPLEKRTAYVAHEILQMKPVFSKNNTYGRFITSNAWIYRFFPNARRLYHAKRLHARRHGGAGQLVTLFLQPFEYLLRLAELAVIAKNKTGFFISRNQLWLFRKDFEPNLKDVMK